MLEIFEKQDYHAAALEIFNICVVSTYPVACGLVTPWLLLVRVSVPFHGDVDDLPFCPYENDARYTIFPATATHGVPAGLNSSTCVVEFA